MKIFFDEHPERLYFVIGLSYLIIGGFLVFYKCIFSDSQCPVVWSSILITIGIAFITYGLSRQSNTTMTKLAYSSYYETLGEFEDRRLILREKKYKLKSKKDKIKNLDKNAEEKIKKFINSNKDMIEDLQIYLTFSIWKCKTYLDRALLYKQYLTEEQENQLIHHVDCFFIDICEGIVLSMLLLNSEPIRHLEMIYNNISKLKTFQRDVSIEDELRRERILNNLKFCKRLTNIITDFNYCSIVRNYPPPRK